MISGHHKRARLAAAFTIAMMATVSTAGAVGTEPTDECEPAQGIRVVAVDKLVAQVTPASDARVAELRARVQQARRAVELSHVDATRLEEAVHLEMELVATADLQELRADVWLDRDMDVPDMRRWNEEWHHIDIETQPEVWTPWGATSDAIVSAARFPARAGLVAEHVLGAFAKVTPRVVRALF